MAKVQLTDKQIAQFFTRLHTTPDVPQQSKQTWREWKVEEWPNRMGFDVGPVEVWKYKNAFGCRSENRCLHVPYAVTTNPLHAAEMCFKHGLLNRELAEMDYETANAIYFQNAVTMESV